MEIKIFKRTKYNSNVNNFETKKLIVNIWTHTYHKNKVYYSNGIIQYYDYLLYRNRQFKIIYKTRPKSIRKEIRKIKKMEKGS